MRPKGPLAFITERKIGGPSQAHIGNPEGVWTQTVPAPHNKRGAMTEEEIRHITVKVLDAQSVIDRFHQALDRCASGAGDGGGACSSSAPSALAAAKRACARCTFDNHPDNVECDMCGSLLPHQS